MDIIRAAAEPECSQNLVTSIAVIDGLLAVPRLRDAIKGLFGLGELEHDDDFAGMIEVCPQFFKLTLCSEKLAPPPRRVLLVVGNRRIGTRNLEARSSTSSAKHSRSLWASLMQRSQ